MSHRSALLAPIANESGSGVGSSRGDVASRPISNRSAGARAGRRGRLVCLIDADPELAWSLPDDQMDTVRSATLTRVISLPEGTWINSAVRPDPRHLGYLVLDGLMLRELRVVGGCSIELLAEGDVLRPWQEDSASFCEGRFRAVAPTRLAALDPAFAERISAWPQLTAALLERALRRSRMLAAVAAIGHVVGLDQRLEALFWCLAERWGTVTPDGVRIRLSLTHQALADMIGAQRPSVTTALGRLARAGTLVRADGAWTLRSEPPASANGVRPATRR